MHPRSHTQDFVFKWKKIILGASLRHRPRAVAGLQQGLAIPTMALKINVAATYIMPPACRVPRDEFRRFQVSPAGAGNFLAAQGWQLP